MPSRKKSLGPYKGRCPPGKITIKKFSYKKKSGKRVTVPAHCISEKGKRGAGRGASRKVKVLPTLKKGELGQYGYKVRIPAAAKKTSLKKALKGMGYSSLIKRLNVLSIYNKNSNPEISTMVKRDMATVRKLAGRTSHKAGSRK